MSDCTICAKRAACTLRCHFGDVVACDAFLERERMSDPAEDLMLVPREEIASLRAQLAEERNTNCRQFEQMKADARETGALRAQLAAAEQGTAGWKRRADELETEIGSVRRLANTLTRDAGQERDAAILRAEAAELELGTLKASLTVPESYIGIVSDAVALELDATKAALARAMEVVRFVQMLEDERTSITDYHLNGDEAAWREFDEMNIVDELFADPTASAALAEWQAMQADKARLNFLESGEHHISFDYETGMCQLDKVTGNINDRVWNPCGQGETLRAAIDYALRALKGGTTQLVFTATIDGESVPVVTRKGGAK